MKLDLLTKPSKAPDSLNANKSQKPNKKEKKAFSFKALASSPLFTPKVKPKDINLYKSFSDAKTDSDVTDTKKKLAAPYVGTVIVGVMIIIVFLIMNTVNTKTYNKIQTYIMDAMNIQKYNDTLNLQAENTEIQNGIKQMQSIQSAIASYPNVTTAVLERIVQCADSLANIQVSGYDDSTGLMSFTATAYDVTNIPELIRQFYDTGLFYKVSFSGYTQNSAQTGGYTVKVSCILSDTAGKTNAESAIDGMPAPTSTTDPEMRGAQYKSARQAEAITQDNQGGV